MRELRIYHPNAKGTGSYLKVAQTEHGDMVFFVYPQSQSGGIKVPGLGEIPGFILKDGVSFVADWHNIAEILMVFRGECESLEDGKGLSYTYDAGWSKLMLRHVIEPVCCYVMEVYEKREDVENRGIFRLSPSEALGLSLILEGVLHHTLTGGKP